MGTHRTQPREFRPGPQRRCLTQDGGCAGLLCPRLFVVATPTQCHQTGNRLWHGVLLLQPLATGFSRAVWAMVGYFGTTSGWPIGSDPTAFLGHPKVPEKHF